MQSHQDKNLTEEDRTFLIADIIRKSSRPSKVNKVLYDYMKTNFEKETVEALASFSPPDSELDRLLAETAQEALKAIAERDCRGAIAAYAKKTIGLGMAISRFGSKVKAAFAPD